MTSRRDDIRNSMFYAVVMIIGLSLWIVAVTLIRFIFIDKMSDRLFVPFMSYVSISIGIMLLINGLMFFIYFALHFNEQKPKEMLATIFVIALTYTICLYTALISVYVMPIFMCALVLSQLGQRRQSMIANFLTIIFVSFSLMIHCMIMGSSLLPVLVMMATGLLCGGLSSVALSSDASRLMFMSKSFIICVCEVSVAAVLSLMMIEAKFFDNVVYMCFSAALHFALGLVLSPIIERSFNLITNVRLMELTNHNSPLISRLLKEAPGTFNHSLAVASFAEMCAASIGENPYLARACAYYHDVGKLANPMYFKENQSDYNPHDDILPEVSADILRSHTTKGLELCKQYRIPEEISHVTVQHHGTMLIPVFYNKAQKLTDGTVDPQDYCYRGEIPTTKLAALVMICDSSEAAIRAMDQPDGDKVDKLLRKLINDRLMSGQFDNCKITMRELNTIRETIISAYGGLFHKRLKYPEGK